MATDVSLRLQIAQPGTTRRHRVWFENPRVARPLREDAAGAADNRLFPRDCREEARGVTVCSCMRLCRAPALRVACSHAPVLCRVHQCGAASISAFLHAHGAARCLGVHTHTHFMRSKTILTAAGWKSRG